MEYKMVHKKLYRGFIFIMVLYKSNVTQIIIGKMPTHPLNFRIVAITPPKFLFWLICSMKFANVPN